MKRIAIGVSAALAFIAASVLAAVVSTSYKSMSRDPTYGRSDGWYERTGHQPTMIQNGAKAGQLSTVPTYNETFDYGDDDGLYTTQADWTVRDVAAQSANFAIFRSGTVLGYAAIAQEDIDINMDATGLDLDGDQTDNDGFEVWGGWFGATGRPFFIGVDPAFKFCVTATIADADGTDDFHVGFRRAEVLQAAIDDYNDAATIGIVGTSSPNTIQIETIDDNASTTTTDTTETWADGDTKTLCVKVSAAGVVTYTIDGHTPLTTAAFTWDDHDPVIPFVYFKQNTNLTTCTLTDWDVAYQ